MTKHIFVTGGVVSSLGKGITAASLGRLLKSRGYKVMMQKADPYLNVDPGTMSPFQHGEVFVTEDGYESDLDLGHYERFIDENLTRNSNFTTGAMAAPSRSSRTSRTPSRSASAASRSRRAQTSSSPSLAARSATSRARRSSRPSASSARRRARQTAASST